MCLMLVGSAPLGRVEEGNPPDLLPVYVKGKGGFINRQGKMVIKPRFDIVRHFHDGRACVAITDKFDRELFGYIDQTGKVVVPFQPGLDLDDYSEGRLRIEIKGKYGYLDRDGKVVIKPQFDIANEFHQGLAYVRAGEKYGFIDLEGKLVIPLHIYTNQDRLKDLIRMSGCRFPGEFLRIAKDQKYGFLDRKGRIICPPQFDQAFDFSEGLAAVASGNKWGYLDGTGKLAIPLHYNAARSFSQGLAAVAIGQKYGYVDPTGKLAIPPQFSDAGEFADGVALVHLPDGAKGLVDKQGKIVTLNFSFDELEPFADGMAVVKVDGKYGYVDKQGTLIVKPQYDRAYQFDQGLARVVREDKVGLIDRTGKVVVPLEYDEIFDFQEDRAHVKKGGNIGFIDRTGRLITPIMFVYSEADDYNFHGGLAYVEWEEGHGYIDREGKFTWKSEWR
jgi:hypothetical protein